MKKSTLKKLSTYSSTSSSSSKLVKIGEAAKLLGISIDTLRRWEKRGWLKVTKTPGGTRLYDKDQLAKLNPNLKKGPKSLLTPLAPIHPQVSNLKPQAYVLHANTESEPKIHLNSDQSILKISESIKPNQIEADIVNSFSQIEKSIASHTPSLKLNSRILEAVKNNIQFAVVALFIMLPLLLLVGLLSSKPSLTAGFTQRLEPISNNSVISTKNLVQKLTGIFSPTLSHALFNRYPLGSPPGFYTKLNNKNLDQLASGRVSGDLKGDNFSRSKGQVLADSTPSGSFLQINLDTQINGSLSVDTATVSGALYSATINTGFGDNEVYPMNQPLLTTSPVTFATLTAGSLSGGTLSLTSGSNQLTLANTIISTQTGGSGAFTVSIPALTSNGNFVIDNAVQTLTNKTISGSSNTFESIPNSALSNSSITINAGSGLSGGGEVSLGGSITLTATGGSSSGVTSITGTASQVIASASTGDITLSLPQSIGTTSDVEFDSLELTTGLLLNGSTSGTITLAAPSTVTSYTLSLPSDDGTNGYVLQTDGSGNTSWVAQSGGASSLQDAYDGGNTIATTTGRNLAFTLSSGLATSTSLTLTNAGTASAFILNDTNGATNTSIEIQSGGSPTLTITEAGTLSTSGNISTTSSGTITSASTLTASNGFTMTTGALSLTSTSGAISSTGLTGLTYTLSSGTAAITAPTLNLNTSSTGNTAIGNATGTFALTSNGGLNVTTGGALTGVASIDTITVSATGLTFAGAGTISSTTTSAITLDSGTTGTVNLGTGNNAKTINLGTGTAGNTLNIGTNNTVADTINIGSALDTTTLAGTINISGLSASSAVYTDSSKNLTTTAPTSGTIGYWSRTGTTLSPATSGDAITTSGNMSTTGSGTITSAGTLTASNGFTMTTGALSLTSTSGSISATGLSSASLSVSSGTLALATSTSGDITLTTGSGSDLANILTGNLKVGNGTPTVTLDGEDAYIEGTFETDGNARFDALVGISGSSSDTQLYITNSGFAGNGGNGRGAQVATTFSNAVTNSAYGLISTVNTSAAAYTLTSLASLYAGTNTAGAGSTITNNYGLFVDDQTAGTNDYGIRIDAADTATLWISGGADNTTASSGIMFGSSRDTNLYRSASNTLKTDDAFNVNGNLNISSAGAITAATGITSSGTITFSGLSADSGVYTTTGGQLTTTPPSSGTLGYWSRTGTTLSPATSGDAITTSGNISTTGSGTITSAGLLTGSAGLTITGATASLNASSNFNTNINTGTSTGAISIGNSSAGAIALSTGSTFGITTTTGAQTFTSANVAGTTTSSSYVFNASSLTSGTALYITSSATSGKTVDINASQTSGTVFNLAYGSAKTISGDLTGLYVDLNSGNVDATNQNLTGVNFKIPTVTDTHTSGTKTLTGMLVNFGSGAGINQNGAGGTLEYVAGDFYMPALTQTAGTLNAYGTRVTTPATITTGGTAYGNYISATGVGSGTLSGLGVSSISGGSGTEYALNIGSGWDAVLRVGSTTVINGSGVTVEAGGGTGQSTYTTGDILYASAANTLSKRAIGNANEVLTVVGGVPTWTSISGASCPNCVLNDPTSDQTIAPTGQATTGLIVKQTSTASPTDDIFQITDSAGSTKYFYVDKDGNVSTTSTAGQTLTLTPLTDTTALTLVGTNVSSQPLQYINSKNASATSGILNMAYGAAQTLTGSVIGIRTDLSTNVTATNQSVTGYQITLPGATNTSGTQAYKGIVISGGSINENGGTATTFTGADITIPALTQTSGTLTAYGANITTPSSITTGGTAYGVNIAATGVGAGTLYGVNVSDITAGAGTEVGMQIGSGWDTNLLFNDTSTRVAIADGGSLTILDSAGNSLCTLTDTGSAGNLSCTGTIGGSGTVGFWSKSSTTISPATANDVVAISSNDTSNAVLALTSTGAASSPFTMTANSVTTGTILSLAGSGLTTGEILDITGTWAPTDGSTNEGIDLNFTHAPTSNADVFSAIDLDITDATTLNNTVYGLNTSIALSSNSQRTAYGIYSDLTTSGTSGDILYGGYFNAQGGSASQGTAYGIWAQAGVANTVEVIHAEIDSNMDTGLKIGNTGSSLAQASVQGVYADLSGNTSSNSGSSAINRTGFQVSQAAASISSGSNNSTYRGFYQSAASALTTSSTYSGTVSSYGVDLVLPNITQGAGTINAYGLNVANGTITTAGTQYGVNVTTSSITTAGTQYGLNVAATGVGAGTLYGLNISDITADAGTEVGAQIGSGWDTNLLFNDTTTRVAVADTGTINIIDSAGNSLCTITDNANVGDLSCTGNITGGSTGTIGYWTRSGTTLSTANSGDDVSLTSVLSAGAKSSYSLSISQANDASNNNSVGLLSLSNSDTGSTAAVANISQVANGTALAIDLNTGGSSSKGISFSGGVTGIMIDASSVLTTSGVQVNLAGHTQTSGAALRITGNASSYGTDFTGSLILVNPTRTLATAGATRSESGSYLKIARSNTVNNGTATLNMTGALADLSSNCTQTLGTCNDSSNILSLTQSYASATGSVLAISNSGTAASILLPATNGTASGLQFGTDANLVNLYRSASDTLKTDDAFNVNGNLNISSAGAITAITGYTQASGDFSYSNGTGQFSINSDAFDVTDAGAVSGISALTAGSGTAQYNSIYNFLRSGSFTDAPQAAAHVQTIITAGGGSATVPIGLVGSVDQSGGTMNHAVGVLGLTDDTYGTAATWIGTEGRSEANTNGDFVTGVKGMAYFDNATSSSSIGVGVIGEVDKGGSSGAGLVGIGGWFRIADGSSACTVCYNAVFGQDTDNYRTQFRGLINSSARYANFSMDDTLDQFLLDTYNANSNVVPNGIAFKLGDAAGTAELSILDSASVVQASIDSDGNGDFNGTLTAGSANAFSVNSSGAITAATGITSSGTITFSGLSADSGVYTTTGGQLTTTPPSSGTLGYWSRSGSTLSPANAGDSLLLNNNTAYQMKDTGGVTRSLVSLNSSDMQTFGVGAYNATYNGYRVDITSALPLGQGVDSAFDIKSSSDLGSSDELVQFGDSAGDFLTILGGGNVGIGDSSPAALFTVGASDAFQINSSGAIAAITGYTQSSGTFNLAAADGSLINLSAINMSGTGEGLILPQNATACSAATAEGQICWDTAGEDLYIGNGTTAVQMNSGGSSTWNGITDPTGDQTLTFGDGEQNIWTISSDTETFWSMTADSLTTGDLFDISLDGLTSGTGIQMASTSTVLTGTAGVGSFINLDWSPGSSTLATGDLFALNIGSNGTTTGNLFNILDSSSSIFSVSETSFTTSLPSNFTSAGDVSVAYDINFTNPTASYLKSAAPLYMVAGETFNSSNLTLGTYNQGTIVLQTNNTTSTAVDLTNTTLTTGTGINASFSALTTGTGLAITSSNSSQTSASALSITQSGVTTGYTGNLVSITGTSTTGTGNLLNIAAANTTNGSALNITTAGVTTGQGLTIAHSTSAITTGSLLKITSSGTNALATNGLVSISASGAFTSTSNVGLVNISATSASQVSGTALNVVQSGVTTGYTGNFINFTGSSTTGTGNLLNLTSVNTTNGAALNISAANVTTGKALNIAGSTGTGVTSNFTQIATDVGSAGAVLGISPDFSGAGVTSYGINTVATDTTSSANTDIFYNAYIRATGNAAKSIYGIQTDIQTNSTTADYLYGARFIPGTTGAISAGIRQTVGAYGSPSATGNNSGGTMQLMGFYANPTYSASADTAGAQSELYGLYVTSSLSLTTGGNGHQYGVYVNDMTSTTTGSTEKYGLYIAAQTGADNNYGAYIGSNVGIGDTTPTEAELVLGNAGAGNLYFTPSTTGTTNDAVCWDNAGATLLYDCDSTPADYAESYPVEQGITYGEIVMIGDEEVTTKIGTKVSRLVKATADSASKVIGITSDNYHDFTSAGKEEIDPSDNPMPVALNGRVPVKVSSTSQAIKKGDFITTSSEAGKAAKATAAGYMVGKALEDWTPGSGKSTVMVFVQNTFADPSEALANMLIGNEGQLLGADLSLQKITVSSDAKIGGLVSANNFALNSDMINRSGALASIPVSADNKVNLADTVNALNTGITTLDSRLSTLDSNQASQSAQLAEAKILGEQAINHAQTLDEKVASTSANLSSLSSRIDDLLASISGSEPQSTDSGNLGLTPPSELIATDSATIANLDVTENLSTLNIDAMDATISSTFKSLGETFLGQTTIAGDLSIDGTMSFTNGNSINAFPTLFFQNNPLASAVDFFNGKITLDKDGLFAAEAIALGDQSLGEAVILAGQTEVTIPTSLIKSNSKVFITPTSPLTGNIYVGLIIEGSGFKVKLSQLNQTPVRFNWMIIQEK